MNTTQKVIKIFAIALAVFIIGSILRLAIVVISSIAGFSFTISNTTNFEREYENISSIEINSLASNISIKNGDIFKVEATNVNESFTVKENNNLLVIEEEKVGLFKSSNHSEVIITVPDVTLNNLKIDSGAGKISINDIKTENTEIDQGAGVIEISNSYLNNAEIDGGAGEMVIKESTIHNLDMDAGVGEIDIDADLTGVNNIDCGVGELRLNLQGEDKYSLKITKGLGSIEVDGETKSSDYNHGNGENIVNISGGIGSISVDFN